MLGGMGLHHVAIATKDVEATHRFYTDVMGFRLAKVETTGTPDARDGWAKHLFYDTGGGGMIAFWDLHDETIGEGWRSASISSGLGLPTWVNHLAFAAESPDDLEARKRHMLDQGETVTEIDHGWCRSIYTVDPNGILVEFCCTTQVFTDADRAEAERRFADPHPELDKEPEVRIHQPSA